MCAHRQGIRFAFLRGDDLLLNSDVPFTVNTNGAWYRPTTKYEGVQIYVDKGVPTSLQ